MNNTLQANRTSIPDTINPNLLYAVQDGFGIFFTATGIILNLGLVSIYFKDNHLQTAFNVYVVNLSIAEIVCGFFILLRLIVWKCTDNWPLGDTFCSFTLYWIHIVGPNIRWGHVLIAANRFWAVTFPMHYKQNHSLRSTRLIIIISWVLQQMVHLPLFVLARIWLNPKDRHCTLNVAAYPQLSLFSQIIGYFVSESLMLIMTSIVLIKLAQLRKHRAKIVADAEPTMTHREIANLKDAKVKLLTKKHTLENQILVYLLLGILCCWTPSNFYFLIRNLGYQFTGQTFYAVQSVMLYAYSSIYPILYFVASSDFRRAVKTLFCS